MLTFNRRNLLAGAAYMLVGCAPALLTTTPGDAIAQDRTLTAYRSESELNDVLARWRSEAQKLRGERRRADMATGMTAESNALQSAAPAAPAALAKSADAAGAPAQESITNVQTAGVDEGGIVKRAGDHLVILRRGRLFTVRIGNDALQSVSMLDAYAPNSSAQGAWYDELLISGSTVVVIGYSYARGGTEIGLFDLSPDGGLIYRATYHLRSFDYYSSRNYASRLIGSRIVFYTPTLLHPWGAPYEQVFPAMRRWHRDATPREFERILPATRVYRTDDEFDPREPLALHTVTACDLASAPLRCESSAVLGPAGRVFYVAQGSVYVWTSALRRHGVPQTAPPAYPVPPRPADRSLSAVFRIPLDGTAPSALKTAGVPIDQMSFLEDSSGHLNVLLRESGAGEGMWGSEHTRGSMALLRVPLAAFGDGRSAAQREHYRSVPAVAGYAVQNRFVGEWLLWGGDAPRRVVPGPQRDVPPAWALRFAGGGDAVALHPQHGVERIEALGGDAVLVGNAGADLHFTSVRLRRGTAAIAGAHVQAGARQGETRTHGFFYRSTGAEEGLLGLPILSPATARRHGVYSGAHGSAAVTFLRQRDLNFSALGELAAHGERARDDACKASCVDWYGNARPVFIGERIFALLGYELVEGALVPTGWNERIDERRRISFAPYAAHRDGRYSPFN